MSMYSIKTSCDFVPAISDVHSSFVQKNKRTKVVWCRKNTNVSQHSQHRLLVFLPVWKRKIAELKTLKKT